MARAAGDSRYYEFLLNGDKSLPSIKLVSVTTILARHLWSQPVGSQLGNQVR